MNGLGAKTRARLVELAGAIRGERSLVALQWKDDADFLEEVGKEPSAPTVHGCNRKEVTPGVRMRHTAFTPRDGSRHVGTVDKIEFPDDAPPVIVLKMDDGRIEYLNTHWEAEGPWDLDAPFRTERVNVVGPRGGVL
jgi:hypothetical protein